jgi:pimeloyl-ACP methyl ester carboxylesterase
MKTDFATIRNARLYYETVGTGRPLLLLHSGIADHRMWAEQYRGFSKHFQLVVPDFRGYGKSPPPIEPFRHYEDVYGLIRYLGFKSVTVVGCSLGGKAAIELAIAHPEAVDQLVLVAPGLAGYEYQDKETLAKDAILEGLIASGTREEVADMLVDIWVVGLKRERERVSSSARSLVRQMILDNYDSVVDKYPESRPEFEMISRLEEVRVPTLVIIGDSDLPDMLGISQLIADRIAGARRHVIRDAAHLPNLEHGVLFERTVMGFLT